VTLYRPRVSRIRSVSMAICFSTKRFALSFVWDEPMHQPRASGLCVRNSISKLSPAEPALSLSNGDG
jgi:hypothetical protein